MNCTDLPLYILAGGKASRLGDLSKDTPKYLQSVAGYQCFADAHLEKIASWGFRSLHFCLGHLGNQIEDYLRKHYGSQFDLNFSYDGNKLLGTGGSLAKAWREKNHEVICLTYGDTVLDFSVNDFLNAVPIKNATVCMTVISGDKVPGHQNNVLLREGLAYYNKTSPDKAARHVDYGFLFLNKGFLTACSQSPPFDLSEPLEKISTLGQLYGYEVNIPFREIGTPDALKKF